MVTQTKCAMPDTASLEARIADAVKDAAVKATVVKTAKAKKVVVYRYKRKSGYHKKNGHRQPYTEVKIESINA